jgi:hypothetical protein
VAGIEKHHLDLGLRSVHGALEYRFSYRCIRRNVGIRITSQEVALPVLFYPVSRKENEDEMVSFSPALFSRVLSAFRIPTRLGFISVLSVISFT